MANEVNIVVKMTEDVIAPIKKMSGASKSLNKELEALERQGKALGTRYDSLNKSYAQNMTQAEQLKKTMKDLKKEMSKGGDGAEDAAKQYETLLTKYNELTDAAKGFRASANETMKKINDIGVAAQKLDNGQSNKKSGGILSKLSEWLQSDTVQEGLYHSGVIKSLGDGVSNLAGTVITSAIGQPMADFASQVLSGAVSGAAAGSIAGPHGALIGAGFGAVAGLANASAQIVQKEDDTFKSYYKDLYETVNANTAEALTSGKTLAAKRETTKISFSTLLGGEDQANHFLADVLNTANTTPFLYDDLVGISKTMLSFGTAVEDVIPTLTTVGDAGAALGLSTGDIGTVATLSGPDEVQ